MRLLKVVPIAFGFALWISPSVSDTIAQSEAQTVITVENVHQLEQLAIAGRGEFHDMAWSPDASKLAVATDAGIWVYDAPTLATSHFLDGHTHSVWGVAWSLDGTWLASASSDGTVRVWDVANSETEHVLEGFFTAQQDIGYSRDNTQLVLAEPNGAVRIWDVTTGQLLSELGTLPDLASENEIYSLELSPDVSYIAYGKEDGSVLVRETRAGETIAVLEGNASSGGVYKVRWSPDGARLAVQSGNLDGVVTIWEMASRQTSKTFASEYLSVLAWSPDNRMLVIALGLFENSKMWLWDTSSGEIPIPFAEPYSGYKYGSWSPNGSWLATWSGDSSVRILDGVHQIEVASSFGHASAGGIAFAGDQSQIATLSFSSRTIFFWNILTGQLEARDQDFATFPHDVLQSPDGKRIALVASYATVGGTKDTYISVSDDSGIELHYPTHFLQVDLGQVQWSSDSSHLVIPIVDVSGGCLDTSDSPCSVGTHIVNVETGTEVIIEQLFCTETAVWSPDGTQVAGIDQDIGYIWDAATWDVIRTFSAASCKNRLQWLADGSDVQVINVDRWLPARTWPLAWSPDLSLIITRGDYGVIQFWDTRTATLVHELNFPAYHVGQVAWSPDGTRIAFDTGSGIVRIWGIPE